LISGTSGAHLPQNSWGIDFVAIRESATKEICLDIIKNMHFDSSKITGQPKHSSAMEAIASFDAPVESLNFQMRPSFGSQDRSTLPQRQH